MNDSVVSAPHLGNHTIFLSGPPGSGKTTLAVQRLRHLLGEGVPAEQILVLVPQRTLAAPYYELLRSAGVPAGGRVDVATIGGLAQRCLELFWPLVAGPAGFANPNHRPRFLTLETTQYHMHREAESFVERGAFDGVTISESRLISQVVDNLNKAAAVGFPPEEIAERLKGAWAGESAHLKIYDQVQKLALAFRESCLGDNLLDWSLQVQTFRQYLLPLPQLHRYLLSGYRHLIVDNVEEDIPATHDLLARWLPLCESALVVYDEDGGYRVFLGADPGGAWALRKLCRQEVALDASYVVTPEMAALGIEFQRAITSPATAHEGTTISSDSLRFERHRFHPQMLSWVAKEVRRLLREEGMAPGEIAILAPFLSDALRFSITEELKELGIPVDSHRPSRELREEPATRCLLTLAKLAHPGWRRPPSLPDVALALFFAVADLDPVRARLLADIVYRVRDGEPDLAPFYDIIPETQTRISYLLGGRYDELRTWIGGYRSERSDHTRLDHFLGCIFGELLSQPGFAFHRDLDAGRVAANLIESVRKFGQGLGSPEPQPEEIAGLGPEYVDMVERGLVAAQYVSSWRLPSDDTVLLVPAYTFLMMNRPVRVQFWLDAGSQAWFERIYQPLTHPYVLRRDWPQDARWSDDDEIRTREAALGRLVLGLCRRCSQRVYLAFSELSEQGYEQRGLLQSALQILLRRGERTAT